MPIPGRLSANIRYGFCKISINRNSTEDLQKICRRLAENKILMSSMLQGVWGANKVDPASNSQHVDAEAIKAERILKLAVIVLTSVGSGAWGYRTALQYTDSTVVAWIGALAIAAVAAYVTDVAFSRFLEEVVYQPIWWIYPHRAFNLPSQLPATGRWFFILMRGLRWGILTTIVAGLFLIDYFAVDVIADPLGNMAGKQEQHDVQAAALAMTSEGQADLDKMDRRIRQLEKDIKAAEARVARANPKLAELSRRPGDQWAGPKLRRMQSAASGPLRKELDDLNAAYNQAMAGRTSAVNRYLEGLQADNERMQAEDKAEAESVSNMYWMFGAGLKIGTVAIRIFLVISFFARGPIDANGDGRIDGADVAADTHEAREREDFRMA